jgi:hypothetical protein
VSAGTEHEQDAARSDADRAAPELHRRLQGKIEIAAAAEPILPHVFEERVVPAVARALSGS